MIPSFLERNTREMFMCFRVWLVPALPGTPPMQIGYLNVVPKAADPGNPNPTFDDINETVYKFNQWCNEYPIPGQPFFLWQI